MKEAISDADNKKFSEFSKKVKTSLEDKLRSNPTVLAKAEELRNLQNMKDVFAQIKPVVPTPTVEPEKEETPLVIPTED